MVLFHISIFQWLTWIFFGCAGVAFIIIFLRAAAGEGFEGSESLWAVVVVGVILGLLFYALFRWLG